MVIHKKCFLYQVCKCEMRVSDNRWRNRAVRAINIWRCAILSRHRQVSDVHEWWSKKVCAQYRVVVFYTSKFIPNKEHSRTTLIFCFHSKKTAAESYRLLREACGETVPSQDTHELWFRNFRRGDFKVVDKKHGKPPKSSKMRNCKHCWLKMSSKHKNNSTSNWTLVKKRFPIGHERWERFRRPVDEYHKSSTTGKWKSAKTHLTFYSHGTKEVVFASCSYRGWKADSFWEP